MWFEVKDCATERHVGSGPKYVAKNGVVASMPRGIPAGTSDLACPNLGDWDRFFAPAILIGLYSLRRLAMIREVGEVERHVLVHEFFNEMKSKAPLSSIEGLRQMVGFEFGLLRTPTTRRGDRTE